MLGNFGIVQIAISTPLPLQWHSKPPYCEGFMFQILGAIGVK